MRVEEIIPYQLCVPSSQDSFEAGLIPWVLPFPSKEIEAQGPEVAQPDHKQARRPCWRRLAPWGVSIVPHVKCEHQQMLVQHPPPEPGTTLLWRGKSTWGQGHSSCMALPWESTHGGAATHTGLSSYIRRSLDSSCPGLQVPACP